MTWREVSKMSERQQFIKEAEQTQRSFSELCKDFGIDRSTGYKWLNRYRRKGEAGLVELSKKPKHSPNKTMEEVEYLILQTREEHPSWGGVRIKSYLEHEGFGLPTEKTINRILKRYGRITITWLRVLDENVIFFNVQLVASFNFYRILILFF